jgi:hypothetical protein
VKRALYSLANLLVVKVANKEKNLVRINCVHFAEDGSTVASDGSSFVVVEPVPSHVRFPELSGGAVPGEGGVSVDLEIVEEVIRNVPKGKPEMAFAVMTRNDEKVEFASFNLQMERRVAGAPKESRFPAWRSIIKEHSKPGSIRIALYRKRLIELLQMMDAAAGSGDSANSVVQLEISGPKDGVTLLSFNPYTRQTIAALMLPIDTSGKWLPLSKWMRRLLGRKRKKKVSE